MSPVQRVGRAIRRTPLLAGLPREVAVLSSVAFTVALGFGLVIPILPVFARDFGASAFQAGAVVSAFALVRFVTSPLAGGLVDRFGERTIMTSGLLIVAVSSIAAGFSQTYLQLLVLRGVGGLGSSMFTVSAMALLLRVVTTEQRGRAAGAFQGGFIIGGVAGPAVGGLVVAWSIRAPFFVYAGALLIGAVISLVFLRGTRLREREDEVAEGQENRLQQLRTALRSRAYQAAITSNLVVGFVVLGLRSSAVPLFVVEGLGESATIGGIGFLIAAGINAFLLLPAGRMADTDGRRKAMLWGTLGTAIGMLTLTGADVAANGWGTPAVVATAMFFVAMAIQGAAGAFLDSAPSAVVGDVMGGRRGGIVVATFQMTSDLGIIVGPLLTGLIIDAADFDWAFGLGLALCLMGVAMVVRMPETLRRTPDVEPA